MRKINLAVLSAASAMAFDASQPAAAAAKTTRVPPVITGAGVAIPQPVRNTKRGSESQYPFDTLTEVGMAFGVKGKEAKNLTSIVSAANRKNQINKTNPDGTVIYKSQEVTNPDGSKTTVPTSQPEKTAGKHFYAWDVTPEYAKQNLKGTPLEGSSVLVFRDK